MIGSVPNYLIAKICSLTTMIIADTIFFCSIWTVDLAYLLQKFSIRFSYLTVTLGANPKFSVESYYKVVSYEKLLNIYY